MLKKLFVDLSSPLEIQQGRKGEVSALEVNTLVNTSVRKMAGNAEAGSKCHLMCPGG